MRIIIFTNTIIHNRIKLSRKTVGAHFIRSLFVAFTLTTTPIYGGEWHALSYGEDANFIYETSLIEKSGLFSKEYTVWLKIKLLENKINCGAKSNFSPKQKSEYGERRAQLEDLIENGVCMQMAMKVPIEEVHKVSFGCKSKNISHITYESTNLRGEWVAPTYRIGSHPGSLGYTVMSLYCGN